VSNVVAAPPVEAASVRRSRRVSPYWLVPLIAALIAAWLAWDSWSKEGPTITITFRGAEGLQAGQSLLKYRDVMLGRVTAIELAPDHSHVTVTVSTLRQATPLLRENTIFWVVEPRLFAGNLTGLDTLVSGSYIGMVPGTGSQARHAFEGHEDPPLLIAAEPGRTFLLTTTRLSSVQVGAPVMYRDLNVGQVLGWDLGKMVKDVTIHLFVRAPFDAYVTDSTRFWDSSGVSVTLSGTGVDVQLESLRALLLGGISFSEPDEGTASNTPSAVNHEFPLFGSREAAMAASYTRKIDAVAYFSGSVRGLAKGSEVTMHGLKVGQVTDVGLGYNPEKQAVDAPVHFQVEPERIVGVGRRVVGNTGEAVSILVEKGMRATLQSANLLTGGMMVALDFYPNAPPATVGKQGDIFVIPTTDAGGFSGIEASVSELLRKVNTMPLDKIGADLAQMSAGADQLVNGPTLKQTLASLDKLVATTQATMQQLDAGLAPAVKTLPALTVELEKTLAQANGLLLSFNGAYGDNTRFNRQATESLAQLTETLRSLQSLSDMLSRHPEALIKGRPGGGVE
jgi:paraquat-inducible protein B